MTSKPQADPFMLELFRTELETHSRVLEEGLLKAEGEQSPERIEPLMRAAHSIKGAARMVGLNAAVALAHAMEDVLVAAQRGKLALSSGHVDRLLRANDAFAKLAKSGAPGIPAMLAQDTPAMEALAASLAEAPPEPRADAAVPLPIPPAVATPALPSTAEPVAAEDRFVRVFSDTLDRLVGLASECMVHARSVRPLVVGLNKVKRDCARLTATLEDLRAEQGGLGVEQCAGESARLLELLRRHSGEVDNFSARLELLSERLYGEAVASRMRPFSEAVRGFPRMVRDLAKETGKQVRLEIEGDATPVDRDILEKLEAPLTHLLRNSVDHGIEPPACREGLGKPAEGTLLLSARHAAGLLSIRVRDDGAGIGIEALRKKIVAGGHVPEDIACGLTEGELLEFLFLPGFSTAKALTEFSGRGVGLDVVQAMARSVGGIVRVETKDGEGTTFELQLPLTLSVVRSLLVDVHNEAYALPLARVERVLWLPLEDIDVMEDRQYCTVDGEHIGIVSARQVLQTPSADGGSGRVDLVVISDRLNRYALAVDKLLGERDLVVKPLDPRLGKIPNLSASAILEDGTAVLILDVEDLVRSIDNLLARTKPQKLAAVHDGQASSAKRILVVDDSLTVREVERRLLENTGYKVVVAVDGMDGWNTLQSAPFDLLVADVDMPRMDGIELVRRVRSTPRLSRLPVVIVSYKEQEEYRMKGLEAGANHYLSKSSFHDETFLNTVRNLIGEA